MFLKKFTINSFKRKDLYKTLLIGLFVIILILTLIITYKVFFKDNHDEESRDTLNKNEIMNINPTNYTNILNTVYNDLDNYIGTKIKFSGFVYRCFDFNQNQFVLGRQMIISSDYKAVVVGFLCDLNEAIKYKDGEWVEIEGIIEKGYYHGEIPIIKITKITDTSIPNEEYVYPPSDDYIPVFKML